MRAALTGSITFGLAVRVAATCTSVITELCVVYQKASQIYQKVVSPIRQVSNFSREYEKRCAGTILAIG